MGKEFKKRRRCRRELDRNPTGEIFSSKHNKKKESSQQEECFSNQEVL